MIEGNGDGKIDRGRVEKMAIQAAYRWPRLLGEAGVTEDFFRTDRKLSAMAAAVAGSQFFNADGSVPLLDLAMRAGVDRAWIATEFGASFGNIDQARWWVERLVEAEGEFRIRADVERVFRERSGKGVMEALAAVVAQHQTGAAPGSMGGPRNLQGLVTRYVDDRMETLATGKSSTVSTGVPTLDRYFKGGWRRKEVTVLMAGAGVGKTTFADHLRRSLAQRGFGSILFSAEMSEEQLAERQAHASAMVPLEEELSMDDLREVSRRIREDQAWTALMEIDENPEITPGRVIAKARARLAAGFPLALLVLDTLGKVRIREQRGARGRGDESQGGREYDDLTRALMAMKPVAKVLGLPLLVIHHLREGVTEPTLNDAHGCKHVGREADNALAIWRKERETWARILKARQTRGIEKIDFQLLYESRTQNYIEAR